MSVVAKITRLLGLGAVVAAGWYGGTASAQVARYCDNTLVSNSFYRSIDPSQGGADVTYFGAFQDLNPKSVTATMVSIVKIGAFTVLRPKGQIELAPYQQKAIELLSLRVNNPSGAGAPTPESVGKTIRFICNFHQ